MKYNNEISLNQVLEMLGYRKEKSNFNYKYNIFNNDKFLICGNAGQVWEYLKVNKLITVK